MIPELPKVVEETKAILHLSLAINLKVLHKMKVTNQVKVMRAIQQLSLVINLKILHKMKVTNQVKVMRAIQQLSLAINLKILHKMKVTNQEKGMKTKILHLILKKTKTLRWKMKETTKFQSLFISKDLTGVM